VFLCGQAQDMTGKYLGIWFPISTFVMIGFEHIPANFYLCEIGLLAGSDASDVTFADVFLKNWLPVTLGNFVAGAFIVAGGYSFMFGRLGDMFAITMKVLEKSSENENGKEFADSDKAKSDNIDLEKQHNLETSSKFDRCVSGGSIHGM